MSSPATASSPASGLSMPATRFSSVDLPEPEGPISATKSPLADRRELMSVSTGTHLLAAEYDFERCVDARPAHGRARAGGGRAARLFLRDRSTARAVLRARSGGSATTCVARRHAGRPASGRPPSGAAPSPATSLRPCSCHRARRRRRSPSRLTIASGRTAGTGLRSPGRERAREERDLRAHVGQHARITSR